MIRGRRSREGALDGRAALGLTLVSAAVGVGLAVIYQVFYLLTQRWLSTRFNKNFAILSVVAFSVRLLALGLVLYAIAVLTTLDIMVVGVAFIVVFTLLSGYSLYRFAKGRPPTSPQVLL